MNPLASELLERGFKPRRQLGQNFLFDANFLDFIVREAAILPDDVVLEFGTGPGQLTERLAAQAALVHTIEIDRVLHDFSSKRLRLPNVVFHLGDAIPGGDDLDPALVATVKASLAGRRLRVVSNFPYSVGGSILVSLGAGALPAADALGTLQHEVALRLVAAPGTDDYGPLGILLQQRAHVSILRPVARRLFWPEPRVDSSLVRVTFDRPGPLDPGWIRFLKSVFSQRRKTLAGGLRKLGWSYTGEFAGKRPEQLSPDELESVWREVLKGER